MTDHDGLYHQLYAHREMISELLQGFVAEPWLTELDLTGMERVNAKFYSDGGVRRDGDVVWRIPMCSGGDAFLILFLEFQSTADRFMALRLMVYVGLFWQQLLKEERVAPNGLLPPVFPVVIFNGDPRWAMPLSLEELIGLPKGSPIWSWQPEMRYYVVDESVYAPADLAGRDSLTALLFRLEHCGDIRELGSLLGELNAWFGAHPALATLKSIFARLAARLIADGGVDLAMPEDLVEMKTMLATRMEEWKQQWRREGEAAGRIEGEAKGLAKGEGTLLLRLLERRFGPLTPELRARIAAAEPPALEEWGLRILDAVTIDDVFR
jgi:hypothetical protein